MIGIIEVRLPNIKRAKISETRLIELNPGFFKEFTLCRLKRELRRFEFARRNPPATGFFLGLRKAQEENFAVRSQVDRSDLDLGLKILRLNLHYLRNCWVFHLMFPLQKIPGSLPDSRSPRLGLAKAFSSYDPRHCAAERIGQRNMPSERCPKPESNR